MGHCTSFFYIFAFLFLVLVTDQNEFELNNIYWQIKNTWRRMQKKIQNNFSEKHIGEKYFFSFNVICIKLFVKFWVKPVFSVSV